jgi:RNA polymerase sigma-70 factor, ECF subfamily
MEDLDHELMRAIGDGDSLAFERLVTRYQSSVYNFIRRHIGDRHTAEDLTQEVFFRVYRAASEFESRGKVRTWIFKIAFNLCLNELKRMRRLRGLHDSLTAQAMLEAEGSSAGVVCHRELEEEVLSAMRRLPESQRAALLLRAGEGLSYLEISKVLGVSVSSVESLIFRARSRLREALRKKE